jgi:hypothetical protein
VLSGALDILKKIIERPDSSQPLNQRYWALSRLDFAAKKSSHTKTYQVIKEKSE